MGEPRLAPTESALVEAGELIGRPYEVRFVTFVVGKRLGVFGSWIRIRSSE